MTVRVREAVWGWAVIVACAISLTNLIEMGSWVGSMVALLTLVVLAVLVAQTACQRLGLLWRLIAAGLLGEFALTCGVVHRLASEVAPWGFLPSWRALKASDQLLANALASVPAATPPVSDSTLFAPLAILIIGHLAVIMAVVAVVTPWRALIGLAAAAPWICVCTLRLDAGWGWAVVTALCYLGLLAWGSPPKGTVRLGSRRTSEPTGWGRASGRGSAGPGLVALVLAAVCGIVCVLAAPAMPGWGHGVDWAQTLRGNGRPGAAAGPGIGVNGVFNLNQQLTQSDSTVVLRVKGDYAGAIKVYSLYDFNGWSWTGPTISGNVAPITTGVPLWPASDGTTGWTSGSPLQLDLTAWPLPYLPMPLGPRTVDLPPGMNAFYSPLNDAVSLSRGGAPSAEITETAPALDLARIASNGVSGDASAGTADDVPVPLPHAAQIAALAQQIVTQAGATTPDAKLRALVAYLQGPHFQYTLTPRFDPASTDQVWDFLQRGTGYCVHFASALVVMGRSLGIPMRVGLGYSGGTVDSDGWRTFTSGQAHMWAEAHLDGVGWVPYEATKSSPELLATAGPTSAAPSSVEPSEDLPTLGASSSAPTVAPSSAAPVAVEAPVVDETATRVWIILTFLLAGVVAVVACRLFPVEHRGAEAVWSDVVIRARELGLVTDATTPRQIWTALRPHLPDGPPRQAWDGLAGVVEASRYRPPDQRPDAVSHAQLRAWRAELLNALKRAPRHVG